MAASTYESSSGVKVSSLVKCSPTAEDYWNPMTPRIAAVKKESFISVEFFVLNTLDLK